MPVDLRCKQDRPLRERAAEPFADGRTYRSAAAELGVPCGEDCPDTGRRSDPQVERTVFLPRPNAFA